MRTCQSRVRQSRGTSIAFSYVSAILGVNPSAQVEKLLSDHLLFRSFGIGTADSTRGRSGDKICLLQAGSCQLNPDMVAGLKRWLQAKHSVVRCSSPSYVQLLVVVPGRPENLASPSITSTQANLLLFQTSWIITDYHLQIDQFAGRIVVRVRLQISLARFLWCPV